MSSENKNQSQHSIDKSLERFESLSIAEFISLLYAQMKIIVLVTASSILITLIYAFTVTPTYKPSLMMIPAEQPELSGSQIAGQLSGLANLVGLTTSSGTGPTKSATALAILTSRSFAEEFIKRNNLMKELNYKDWDDKRKKWKKGEPSMWATSTAFSSMLEIVEDRKSSIITLSIEWKDPVQAAQWLNESVDFLNLYIRNQTLDETAKNLEYLESELVQDSSNNAQAVLYALMSEEQSNAMMASVREQYSMKIIDRAVPPEKKFKPQRLFVLVTGTGIGFIFSILLILCIDLYQARNRS
tara:strand:- start:48109 stop:49008 length:900 start_codon:yes stop_codon:yes gene_type:complete